MFKKILVGLDGSEQALKALDIACGLCLFHNAQLHIISVFKHHSFMEGSLSMVRGSSGYENMDEVLGEYAKEIVETGKKVAFEHGLEKDQVKGFIRSGQVAKNILSLAKTNSIDLIVVGKQGRGDLTGYLLGGVSHKISGLSTCPVLIV